MTEWIDLYNHESETAESSWVRAIGWSSGSIILRRYEDDPADFEVYKYEPVDREIFEQIRIVHENDGSVGSKINELIINNPDVPAAEKADMSVTND